MSRAFAASASREMLSPSRSRVAVIFRWLRSRTASTAVVIVSPATNRAANFRASGLLRTKRKIRGCSDSHSRLVRIMSMVPYVGRLTARNVACGHGGYKR